MSTPFHPIIYVRGYAMTAGERDDTAADPFCGFNLGSTVYRASVDRKAPPHKFIFESPLLRLISDFGYQEVYENGYDILAPEWQPREGQQGISARSVIIHRYYDDGSRLLGNGKPKEIEDYSRELSALILRVRDLVVAQEGIKPEDFKCYLVAHSMGGLVCRGLLQNRKLGTAAARQAVAKLFTYGTPHNGIDVAGINVPSWLGLNEINTFNRERIAEFLDMKAIYKKYGRVDFMPASALPIQNVFCMVGTNRNDYDAGAGLSRTFVGHGSDGLVKIENASLWGLDDRLQVTQSAATGYTYRAHSGVFGLVNSEEAYQNLVRFLFGDVRVDIWLKIDEVSLPKDLQGKDVEALYQFELAASPRGKRWQLTRRMAEEDSPACRTHRHLTDPKTKGARLVYLSTVFLANRARVNDQDPSLAYHMDLGVRVPDYEVNRRFWPNSHFEGAYLFRDQLVVKMVPPAQPGGVWSVAHGWASKGVGQATEATDYRALGQGLFELKVDFASSGQAPGIKGQVLLSASAWNV
ncbi:hypothetical protein WNB94_10955 [Aquabacterium sp. A3]|uniref:esterase/lipase family protein n=1 Tax=Aquabacterium sp. A3 TaxID=3132829 RepID=UPI00311A660C